MGKFLFLLWIKKSLGSEIVQSFQIKASKMNFRPRNLKSKLQSQFLYQVLKEKEINFLVKTHSGSIKREKPFNWTFSPLKAGNLNLMNKLYFPSKCTINQAWKPQNRPFTSTLTRI